jgi:hypothetical protein
MKEVVGKNIHQAARTSSVRWLRLFGVPKVLDNVVLCLLPLWSPIGVVVVLNSSSCFLRRKSRPHPRTRTQTAPSQSSGARCMFSKASFSSAFSFLMLCGFLVGGGRCSVKNNGFAKFMKNGIQVSSHLHSD